MKLRDQIETRTTAANTSAVWKHLKRSERETQTSLQAQNTVSERLLSKYGLANKLQNVMFSKTRTNGMYSNSAARARGARVQSARKFCAETLT